MKLSVFRRDVKVHIPTHENPPEGWEPSRNGGGVRGMITRLSERSARNLKHLVRNVEGLEYLATLTYPAEYPTDGTVVKYHLKVFCQWLRRRGVKGVWFLEFQGRGAPHFHLLMDQPVPYEDVSRKWFEIAGGGDRKHLVAGTRVEKLMHEQAAARYAEKYAVKPEQKQVPEGFTNVGRFWGVFGGLRVEPVMEMEAAQVTKEAFARVFDQAEQQGAPKLAALGEGWQAANQTETLLQTALRVARRLYNKRRQAAGLKRWRYKGVVGFTTYDTAAGLGYFLARSGLWASS